MPPTPESKTPIPSEASPRIDTPRRISSKPAALGTIDIFAAEITYDNGRSLNLGGACRLSDSVLEPGLAREDA